MEGTEPLPYGASRSDQASLVMSVVLFVVLLAGASGYIFLHILATRIARRLRSPPPQLNENIKQAIEKFRAKLSNEDSSSGLGLNRTSTTDPYIMLPSYGNKTPAVRRRLILASSNPGSYNTYFGNRRIKLSPVDARSEPLFQPAYYKSGSEAERKIIFGFFHPYANAGGGGERVLWAAIKATLEQSERNICVIYTGLDPPPAPAPVPRGEQQQAGTERVGHFTDINRPERILEKARTRFGLEISDPSRVVFIYLTKRRLVNPASWPRLTLLLQAAGSVVLAYEALTTLIPDVWVDTMGYPFAYPLVNWIANIPIAAYVHYPVISTDMITGMVRSTSAGIKKLFKYLYWTAFSWAYTFVGSYVSIIMANSTWTTQHMRFQWWWGRGGGSWRTGDTKHVKTVYPPCATQDLEKFSLQQRSLETIYIAQFRPEKRHELVLEQFAKFLTAYKKQHGITENSEKETPKLVLIGSIRNDVDRSSVYNLRILAHELKLDSQRDIEFVLDAPWSTVTERLSRASFGIDSMWNEHFGMVIVEYMAAGLVPIVHDSAGPKLDIVIPWGSPNTPAGKELPTGFHFLSETDPDFDNSSMAAANLTTLADCFEQAYALSAADLLGYRERAREASGRFSDAAFAERWNSRIEALAKLQAIRSRARRAEGLAD